MGYDLYVRADRQHLGTASVAEVAALCGRLGLCRHADEAWSLDRDGSFMSVYLATVRTGAAGSDALDGDGIVFNELQCHPKPLDARAAEVVYALAEALGWEIWDPQWGTWWREPGPSPDGLGFRFAADQPDQPDRQITTRAKANWVGWATSLAALPGGSWAVGYGGQFVTSATGVHVRDGLDFDSVVGYPQVRPPVAASVDGRLLAAAETDRDSVRVLDIVDGDLRAGAAWPVWDVFAWLPDWPEALLALTRHTGRRDPAATGPIADLESGPFNRLVVVDTAGQRVHALQPDELVGDEPDLGGDLVVSGDGEAALLATQWALHCFSLSTGRLQWRRRGIPYDTHWHAAAASVCGRLVAVGGRCVRRTDPQLLQIREVATGRLLAAFSGTALGTVSTVSALAFHPSGWLAVGFANGTIRHVTPGGSIRSYRCDDQGVRTLAFSPNGAMLMAGGTWAGLRLVELLPDERRPRQGPSQVIGPAERAARIRTFDHAGIEAVYSTDPQDILVANPRGGSVAEHQVARLAALPEAESAIEPLLRRSRILATGGWIPVAALARVLRQDGRYLPTRYHDLVAELMAHASTQANLDFFAEIVAAIEPEQRDAVVLARLEPPAWDAFRLATPTVAARTLVDLISGWPRGIYTQLHKRYGAGLGRISGYSAKEFWDRAADTLVHLGAAATTLVTEAAGRKGPHQKFFAETLRRL